MPHQPYNISLYSTVVFSSSKGHHSPATHVPMTSSVLQHHLPPSEGGTFPTIFRTPSEGGKMQELLQNGCRAFPVLQRPLPPSEGGTFPAIFRAPSEGGKMGARKTQSGIRTRTYIREREGCSSARRCCPRRRSRSLPRRRN